MDTGSERCPAFSRILCTCSRIRVRLMLCLCICMTLLSCLPSFHTTDLLHSSRSPTESIAEVIVRVRGKKPLRINSSYIGDKDAYSCRIPL